MGVVFISYRRGETDGQARALKNELAAILGRDRVFMDVDNITLGRDFRHALRERLASCDLMLALIGRDWVSAKDKSGRRRLEDPADFVRMEISFALKRSIPITPVLLQGASMPTAEQLPGDLKELAFRNGFELSHNRWESDVREMIRRLGFSADARRSSPATTPARVAGVRPAPSPAAPRKTLLWSAIAIGAIVVAAGGLLVHDKFSQKAAEEAHRAQIALEQAKADRARAEAEAERVRVMAAADRAAADRARAAAEAEKAKAAAEKAAADRAAANRAKAAADRAAAEKAAADRAAANRAKAAADRAAAEKASQFAATAHCQLTGVTGYSEGPDRGTALRRAVNDCIDRGGVPACCLSGARLR